MIIGIAGAKGAGKNTAADLLTSEYGFKELSFAHPLKRACAHAFSLDYRDFHDHDRKEKPFAEGPIRIGMFECQRLTEYLRNYGEIGFSQVVAMYTTGHGKKFNTPREILQFVGTEMVRGCIRDSFWCDAMLVDIKKYKNVVIPDVRFPNERAFLRTLEAPIILIDRPTLASDSHKHSSESSMGGTNEYDRVFINDSSISDLHNAIDAWFGTIYDKETGTKRDGAPTGDSPKAEVRAEESEKTIGPKSEEDPILRKIGL
jgi:hypothetical protein